MCGNRPPKLRGVNRDVGLNFTQLNGIPAVHPSEDHAKRHLDSADIAIIGIIDLSGNASDGRFAIAHHAEKQARFLVEVQGGQSIARARPLHYIEQPILADGHHTDLLRRLAGWPGQIADSDRHADAQIGEGLFDLPRKTELRIQLCAIQFTAGQWVFAKDGEGSYQPTFGAVERPGADAACGSVREIDYGGALIGEFGEDLDPSSSSEAAEAHTFALGDVALQAGQSLDPANRLYILVDDRFCFGLTGHLGEDVIHFLRRRAIHKLQTGSGGWTVAAVMATPAGDHLASLEVVAIDGRHHLDHLTRPGLFRRVGSPIYFLGAGSGMTIRAVETEGGAHDAHGAHEVVHRYALHDPDVLERLV